MDPLVNIDDAKIRIQALPI